MGYVARNESVNQAIAEKLQFGHKMCKIQQFACKVVNNLLVQGGARCHDWQFDECHSPNCNLLPLSFDLSRVLMEYLPCLAVLKDILIPFIGYTSVNMYSVVMEAKNIKYSELNDVELENHDFFDGIYSEFDKDYG